MSFCGTQNISVLRVEIKLGVNPNSIQKVDLVIALNRIFGDFNRILLKQNQNYQSILILILLRNNSIEITENFSLG
jgi:hypothetical protein